MIINMIILIFLKKKNKYVNKRLFFELWSEFSDNIRERKVDEHKENTQSLKCKMIIGWNIVDRLWKNMQKK